MLNFITFWSSLYSYFCFCSYIYSPFRLTNRSHVLLVNPDSTKEDDTESHWNLRSVRGNTVEVAPDPNLKPKPQAVTAFTARARWSWASRTEPKPKPRLKPKPKPIHSTHCIHPSPSIQPTAFTQTRSPKSVPSRDVHGGREQVVLTAIAHTDL